MLGDALSRALGAVFAIGAFGGLIGGFFAGFRTKILGSLLMGAIGGFAGSAIGRATGLTPFVDAGFGYSIIYGFAGGIILAYAVGRSSS